MNVEIESLWEMNKIFDEHGEIVGYARKIRKMMNEYEDLVFFLSTNSKESITQIKNMNHAERIGFQQRIIKNLEAKQKAGVQGRQGEHD